MKAPSRRRKLYLIFLVIVTNGLLGLWVYNQMQSDSGETIGRWFNEPSSRDALMTAYSVPCPGAPFLLPSTGFIGLLWRDPAGPYSIFRRHTGIDIFGDGPPGTVPVVAAYDGFLLRRADWLATVAIQHEDPLQPGRIIWTYYTHMANRAGTQSFIEDAFPPGTAGVFVEQGTLLGYQGEYSGTNGRIGLHLHFSIVTSEADGSIKNEAVLENTLDPSPYLGLSVNIGDRPARPVACRAE